MLCKRKATQLAMALTLLSAIATAQGATLRVNCDQSTGLNSIAAALRVLRGTAEATRPTILVSGNCKENVVIQGMDRITLAAVRGASISDASGGSLDVVSIRDSRDVTITGFAVNAGADGVSGSNGISCMDLSVCRLSGNVIQGAADGSGLAVLQASAATLNGDRLQDNGFGIDVIDGSSAQVYGATIQNNSAQGNGIQVLGHSFVITDSVIANNGSTGVFVTHNSTLRCLGCQIMGNAAEGVIVRRDSSARFSGAYAITANIGAGVELSEASSALFAGSGQVIHNTGGTDVVCGASFTTAKLATTNIGGGTTNCVEPQ